MSIKSVNWLRTALLQLLHAFYALFNVSRKFRRFWCDHSICGAFCILNRKVGCFLQVFFRMRLLWLQIIVKCNFRLVALTCFKNALVLFIGNQLQSSYWMCTKIWTMKQTRVWIVGAMREAQIQMKATTLSQTWIKRPSNRVTLLQHFWIKVSSMNFADFNTSTLRHNIDDIN